MALLMLLYVFGTLAGLSLAEKDVAVIENPEPNFRDKSTFQCYVCHPSMPSCGNRIDCCVEPNPAHLQTCAEFKPSADGITYGACFKTTMLQDPFYNVTRGCNKRGGLTGSGKDECNTNPSTNEETCNCDHSLCNGGSAMKMQFGLLIGIVTWIIYRTVP
ncbi:uncharacterized protein LOC129590818 [Paramacrobiotus metropolitanus]|uniref:uncharacterized protein LOC129590818 n=1 Tax=Paramacrobiotus metropolitanus TaxID=2943436 RepID=UPI002445FFC0|nr:uncharacterized protein LOC129590818 [Paramacrobiotus metropolitanus]